MTFSYISSLASLQISKMSFKNQNGSFFQLYIFLVTTQAGVASMFNSHVAKEFGPNPKAWITGPATANKLV